MHAHLSHRLAPAAEVGSAPKWMASVLLVCLLLVLGVRFDFSEREQALRARGENERARLFVGEEIGHSIQTIERDVYRLALTQNAASSNRIQTSVDDHLRKLREDLQVLEKGGVSRRKLHLNIEGTDEAIREASYQPEPGKSALVMEVVEISPQLDVLQAHINHLLQLLQPRWQAVTTSDRTALLHNDEEITLLLKQIAPFFERLNENANRLFWEGDQRLRTVQAELQAQSTRLQWLESGLIAVIVLLGGALGFVFMRQLSAALAQAQAARLESEHQRAQTATMLDTLSDGVYATDLQGRVTFINASGEQVLGWGAAALVGQDAHIALHHTRADGTTYPVAACPLLAVLEQGTSMEGIEHFIHRQGHQVPVSYRSKPLLHMGQIVGSLVSFHDISARLASEARIRLQQAALDAAVNMILITDRNGRIEYVNPAFCRTTGYAMDEVIGHSTNLLNSGLQDRAFYTHMWQTLLQGHPWEGELSNRRKNGDAYPEQMTITPILQDGEIVHFVAIKRDISEEVKTRTRLRLVETAIQEIDQGIHIMDAQPHPQGPVVEYVNAGFARITGYVANEVVGQRAGMLRGAATDPATTLRIEQAMAAGERVTLELTFQRKDGTPLISELHLSPVHGERGGISHYIGLISDISLRKQAEEALHQAHDQALETSRLKSEFLSTMSHEIRTPMNGIIGMTDLLLDTPLNAEQRDFTRVVRDSAQALLVVINDILDFSKIEAGKLEVEITPFILTQVVEGTVGLLVTRAAEKSLTISSFIDPSLPPCVHGDPTRLRQVMLNLLGNAIKFTDTGHVEVSVLRAGHGAGEHLRVEIVDTGIGISPAVQARLFQSFTQADSSTTRKYGGTGLGLAICKRLVELMGGCIGVQSSPAAGSTFWFTLPLHPCDSVPEPTAPDSMLPVFNTSHRVLVVDDHAVDRRVIQRYLNSWGMANEGVDCASQAIAALQSAKAADQPYDVALVDYMMPGMDGLELARVLRADPTFAGLRLVLLSAHDQRDLQQRALAAGYAACLSKPVRQSQLFDSLDSLHDKPELAELTEATVLADSNELELANPDNRTEGRQLILLAEDNLVNQKVAQLQLNKMGYAVQVVGNGQEALEAVTAAMRGNGSCDIAAVLMDCQMPVLDGFEATAAIRQARHTGQPQVPIIAMTANAMQGDRERCIAAGMDDYLSKPIAPLQLQDTLVRWVGHPLRSSALP
jgi:polar amino acid transport system substrate-binding protein